MSESSVRRATRAALLGLLVALATPALAASPPDGPPSGVVNAQTPANAGVVNAETPANAGVVNVNTASAEQLQLLPRVGPALAGRIIEYRSQREFKKVVELARVKGIGLKTVRRLKPWLTVSGPTTLTERVRVPRAAPGDLPDEG